MEDLMTQFDQIVEEGVAIVKDKYGDYTISVKTMDNLHKDMIAFSEKKNLPNLVSALVSEYPDQQETIKFRILALLCEGKQLKDSMLP